MSSQTLTYQELAGELKISPRTLTRNWRDYPHYFVTPTPSLKSARFDLQEVIDFLKKKSNGSTTIQNEGWDQVPGILRDKQQKRDLRGLPVPRAGSRMDSRRKEKTERRPSGLKSLSEFLS